METLYWILEYGKVLFGYMFFMFLWPSVVFSRHLRCKDKVYRFSFCVLIQVVIANSVVLVLGLLHILNRWVVFGVFHSVFWICVVKKMNIQYQSGSFRETLSSIYRFVMGTSGIKTFLYRWLRYFSAWIKSLSLKFWNIIRLHSTEYAMLFIVVIYGMIYFSYGVFQDYNYGFGDMYVHHQWVYGLQEGMIFADGVYPEAMHCFIYCLYALFGIRVYSCMLFLAGIHVLVFLVSAYCFFREIFEWKYTSIFVLIMFLIVDLKCINEVYSMSRLQWTIPQEFGLYTLFLCALYLLRYLNSSHKILLNNRFGKYIWNENLFLFMMSLSASIAIHFYSTIMAFFICASIAVFFLRTILKKERFLPLILAVVCGLLITVTPMLAALASGIQFQGSIGWAVGVINGDDSEEEIGEEEKVEEETIEGETIEGETIEEEKVEKEEKSERNVTKKDIAQKLKEKLSVLYWQGYAALYQEERANWIIGFTGLSVVLWIAYQIVKMVYQFFTKRQSKYFCGYMPVILASVLFMIIYASPGLGIPQLIAGARVCTTEQLLLLAIVTMPVDMIFTLLCKFCIDCILQILSIATAVGTCSGIIITGNYHGYLYCELTRYNSAVSVTDSIINNFPQYSYTIVSTTDELYQVIEYGRHEELLDFIQEVDKNDYKLPTEYVFLYVEKRPIEYGHSHYFSGPAWLAEPKYTKFYIEALSQCPEISASEISKKEAQKDILFYSRPSLSYSILESRTILESKAYLWCQNFSKVHPFEMNVYYEDENFVCYYFKQNPFALYDLAIEDWDRMDGVQW